MARLFVLLVFASGVVGCPDNEKTAPTRESAGVTGPSVQDEPTESAPSPRAPELPSIEAEARQLLDAWLAAQNEGDFDRYATLYAPRFEGVKRSGTRASRFAREGWLEDRRRMFARPMHVEAASVEIAATPSSAIVTFQQTWSSATYSDVGAKRLVMMQVDESVRISREEMLDSQIVGDSGPAAPGIDRFMFVVEAQGLHVVLHIGAEDSWATGPVRLGSRATPAVGARRAYAADLPGPVQAARGKQLQLFGPNGPVCQGRVGPLRVLRRIVPHFSTRAWYDGDEEHAPAPNTQQIADSVWEQGVEGAIVVGAIQTAEDCAGALWAQPADAPRPVFFAKHDEQLALEPVLSSFRRLPAFTALQRDYGRASPSWDTIDGAQPRLARFAADDRAFLSISVTAGNFCGDWGGTLTSLFEESGERLSPRGHFSSAEVPRAVFDLDGDGLPELLLEDQLLVPGPDGYVPVLSVKPAYLDCDC